MALFEPFRAIGHIVDDVPFAVQRRGRETYATVSVGNAWQIYNTAKLTVVLIGPQLPRSITALACAGDVTLAALEGGDIVETRRVHVTGVYRGHTGSVVAMQVLGSTLLTLSTDGTLRAWTLGERAAPLQTLELGPGFTPSTLAHPDTYLNKVVVGSAEGRLQLWNFSTGTLLHEFRGLGSGIRVLAPSPALDVIGLGLADGRVVLLDLRHDEVVAEFSNAAGTGASAAGLLGNTAGAAAAGAPGGGAVTALAFRTGPGVPLLAAGGACGAVTLWDLEKRRLHSVLRDAHDAGVTRLHFFVGEPRLMSAGRDNAAKQWVLDGADGAPRLLRFRAGHAAPPALVRHYGAGRALLSAGEDRTFRLFSAVADAQSRELSQRHLERRAKRARVAREELRLPRVVALAAGDARERDWANVVTAHAGEARAFTWRLAHAVLGEHAHGEAAPRDAVTAVALSACGNFAVVGSADGAVHRYNMQSGLHRGEYQRQAGGGDAASEATAGRPSPAHDGAVAGLASDGANRWLVSGGEDGALRTWDFKRCGLTGELGVGAAVQRLACHPASGLVAVAPADLMLRIYDVEAQRLVRRFEGHLDRVTDLQFSEDCRWLLSSSMDGTLRVWDIPGSQLLQVLDMGGVVTSLSLSPAQDLLATTGQGSRGINLWANQLIYGAGGDIVPGSRVRHAHLPALALEISAGEGADALATLRDASSSEDEEEGGGAASTPALRLEDEVAGAAWAKRTPSGAPAPLAPAMLTLSLLPRSQWQSLAHLDVDGGEEPSPGDGEEPALAAAAMAAWGGSEDEDAANGDEDVADGDEDAEADADADANAKPRRKHHPQSRAVLGLLRTLTPVQVDGEVRALTRLAEPGQDGGEGERLVDALLAFLEAQLCAGSCFDLVQALLRLTLDVHAGAILSSPSLQRRAAGLAAQLRASWQRVDDALNSTRCVLGLLGNLQP
ncbi:putative WD repeat-containing protein [Auxenochlorella protothecoides]|uniref:Putative WD repeat-containing protein n=1 Tax=Auxenochlorella protothecoides TaxID=3075 RepID=A0A087SLJ3_AUXPR|nr:putative WD repeat-containing protein [Auxenochlorella protothecoides]KFM26597.1 putative WD repeat-containing protein [Auxenochlorella protothecoides]